MGPRRCHAGPFVASHRPVHWLRHLMPSFEKGGGFVSAPAAEGQRLCQRHGHKNNFATIWFDSITKRFAVAVA